MGTDGSRADAETLINLMVKRSDLIAELRTGPKYNRDLQDRLGVSRSTVYKAIRELKEHGIVVQTKEGNRLSLLGELVEGEYRSFVGTITEIRAPGSLLAHLAPGVDLDPAMLVGAEQVRAERHAPDRPLVTFEEIVTTADEIRGLGPVTLPQYVSVFRDELVDGELAAELLLERQVAEYLLSNYREAVADAATDGDLGLLETDESIPFGLLVVDDPGPEAVVFVYDDRGTLRGLLRNDSRDAVEWASSVYESYRGDAGRVSVADD